MSIANVEALLTAVAGNDPCGADLEYGDPAFLELDRAAQGKAEQQIGSTIIPAEPPDWKVVARQATELFGKTKDLRIAVHLAKALLNTEGLKGFADGLTVIDRMIQTFWDGLHPRLDPDDDNDPTMRINILATLTAPDVVSALRAAPLVSSRTLGRFSYKDVEAAASGGAAAAGGNGTPPSTATIDAAALDCDIEELKRDTAAGAACAAALTSLDAALSERVGPGSIPGFPAVVSLVGKITNFLKTTLARRSPAAASAVGGESGDLAGGNSAPGQAISFIPGEIGSREDVLRTLDKIVAYYSRHEPSSPIPLFIERCKKLVTMSFIDIVKELVPDAVRQVEVLTGTPTE
jgi:type VI secretion system protein ImpA